MTPDNIKSPEGVSKEEIQPDYEMYDQVLAAFREFMKDELAANYLKGDRNGPNGWIHVKDKKTWLADLYYHVGKLQSAWMNNDTERIKENCADIANIALMSLDVNIDLMRFVPDYHYQEVESHNAYELIRALQKERDELKDALAEEKAANQKALIDIFEDYKLGWFMSMVQKIQESINKYSVRSQP